MLTGPGYGSAFLTSAWAFRIPIWCQLVSSVIVAIGVFFLPESPRWLVAQDRVDEARAILGKYHGEGTLSYLKYIFWANKEPKAERIIQSSTCRSRRCTTRSKLTQQTSGGGIIALLSKHAMPDLDLFASWVWPSLGNGMQPF
jgi:hypothetical protein